MNINVSVGGLSTAGNISSTNSITVSSGATWFQTGGIATFSTSATINAGGFATLTGGSLSGVAFDNNGTTTVGTYAFNNTSVNNAGSLTVNGTTTGTAPIVNTGTVIIDTSGNLQTTGAYTQTSGGTETRIYGAWVLPAVTWSAGSFNLEGTAVSLSGTDLTGTGTAILGIGTVSTANVTSGIGITVPTINVTDSADIFNINSTVTASSAVTNPGTINISGTLTGTGTYTSSGTTNINSGGTLSLAAASNNSGTINVNSGGTLSLSGAMTHTGTLNVYGLWELPASFPTLTGTINLESGASITGATAITQTGTGSTINVGSAGAATVTVPVAVTVSNLNILTSGTFATFNGAVSLTSSLSVDTGARVDFNADLTLSSSVVATLGSGTTNINDDLYNSGQITVVGSGTINIGGVGTEFINEATGIFAVEDTPTININGLTFTNNGRISATFNASGGLPLINATNVTNTTLTNGVVQVGYANNYLAAGDYTLLSTGGAIANPGGAALPQPTRYISSFALNPSGNNLVVTVTRDGFGNQAIGDAAQQIGAQMEFLGTHNPTQATLDLLNGLEKTTTDEELTQALLDLFPPTTNTLVAVQAIDDSLHQVEMRLWQNRMITSPLPVFTPAFGDDDIANKHGIWIRPFYNSGHQRQRDQFQGYQSKMSGIAFGIDTQANSWVTLGAAGSYAKSSVTQDNNSLTTTDISTYLGMVYGTFSFKGNSYLDWMVSAGNSNYYGVRNISLPGFENNAVSNYSGQQFSAKVIASKQFLISEYYQLTPMASAQYSFLRNLGYSEDGAGAYNIVTDPDNMNLFRLGVGADFAAPFSTSGILSIPAVHAMFLVNAAGGAQDTNAAFISGGPIFSTSVSQNRLMARFGASWSLRFNNNFEVLANYDYQMTRSFNGQEVFINLRYIF